MIIIIKYSGILGSERDMAKKGKKKRFDVVKAVKSAARNAVGTPPPTRREEPATKRKAGKADKHKPTLSNLLSEE